MHARILFVPAMLFVALCAAGRAGADPPRYTVEFVQSGVWAAGLNDEGWVATRTLTGSASWVYVPGAGPQTLPPLPGADDARANDINNAGLVVGTSGGQPVYWEHVGGVYGAPTALPILEDYVNGTATAVNDVGDIIGLSTSGQFQRTTLFTDPSGPVDVVPLGFWPTPAAMNDARQVCGHDLLLDLDTGQVTNLGVPEGPPNFMWTVAFDLNDVGQVCGYGQVATSLPDNHIPVRFTPGAGWDLVTTYATPYAAAVSINDLGDTGLSYMKRVSIDGEGLFVIGDLLAPTDAGWSFGSGLAIEFSVRVNDNRQILTTGSNADLGLGGLVVLTPTVIKGDVDGDGATGLDDLLETLASWGSPDPACDGSMDGVVDFADLLIVLANWG